MNADGINVLKNKGAKNLYSAIIQTPLGDMMAIADNKYLYLLDFFDSKYFEQNKKQLLLELNAQIIQGEAHTLISIKKDLERYFQGNLNKFKTKTILTGSQFQKDCWNLLKKIHFGSSSSYSDLASKLNKPDSCRAVANAVAKNKLLIIIPCHRIIRKNSQISGYAGGVERKEKLLKLEKILI